MVSSAAIGSTYRLYVFFFENFEKIVIRRACQPRNSQGIRCASRVEEVRASATVTAQLVRVFQQGSLPARLLVPGFPRNLIKKIAKQTYWNSEAIFIFNFHFFFTFFGQGRILRRNIRGQCTW